ncbi:MAG: PQQ-binding-like beta-propeller repeat protein, partial [Anaerolineae bacterium]|nr:PQQ-binding-like beta-propeller repeat protein [Anaerolineae bacterium]
MRKVKLSSTPSTGCVASCLARLVVILIVIGLIALGVTSLILTRREVITLDLSSRRVATGPAIPLPAVDDQLPDLLIVTHNPDDSDYSLTYLSREDHDSRWDSPSFDSESDQTRITLGTEIVYLVLPNDRLAALELKDGDQRWDVNLTNTDLIPEKDEDRQPLTDDEALPLRETGSVCQDCLYEVGDSVIVLTTGGALLSFSTENGDLVWYQWLNNPAERLLLIDSLPAVIDGNSDDSGSVVLVFDPATGQTVRRFEPTCTAKNWHETLGPMSPVISDPSGGAVYFLFGFASRGCAQRWDTLSGEPVWQTGTHIEESIWPRTWLNNTPLLA